LSLGHSKASRQRTMTEHPTAGTTSSSAWAPSHLWSSHLSRWPEPPVRHQANRGDERARTEPRSHNLRRGRCNDQERRSLSPEGLGPKAFRSNMHDACFPKCFRVPSNITKYDSKTNPSVWLEDYRLACRAGGVDNEHFIIQFLPCYLADTSRAWLDHLPRNSFDCWEDLKDIFTSNFQGTNVQPGNPWDLKGCRGTTSSVSPKSVMNSPRSATPTSF
jgi:hypothetical protein